VEVDSVYEFGEHNSRHVPQMQWLSRDQISVGKRDSMQGKKRTNVVGAVCRSPRIVGH